MKNITRTNAFSAALLLLVVFEFSTTPLQAGLVGISATGQVVNINTTTGAGTLIGASGVSGTLSLATNNITGAIYTVDGSNRLDTIDPLTGLATVGPAVTGLGSFTGLNGLAFSSAGVLFAIANNGSAVNLLTVNTTTGAATLIGLMSATLATDIAFSPSGTLYAWNTSTTNGGLMTVNTTTGAGTFLQSGFNASFLTALAFNTSGNLLGANTDFDGINTTTSATTLIGPIGFDVRGMAFTAVPEPGSFVLAATALVGLFGARKSRRKAA